MFLVFDASQKDIIHIILFDKEKRVDYSQPGKNRELLQEVATFLEKELCKKEEILGIAVVLGAGSFTSTRIAVTVANSWAFVQSIPVLGIAKEEMHNNDSLISSFKQQPVGKYITAEYSAEPNIGKKT
ncbi:MAG: hypothetical protein CL685_01750 [Candidatus Magasanikbacteria bacterium]|nr:hypothetical protein [Candidatus Magasanikbacteria bacterium]|tara:strand:+ start:7867 stop:8250 length:384 start_codon:yes stop_codon:yes gene_type:complete